MHVYKLFAQKNTKNEIWVHGDPALIEKFVRTRLRPYHVESTGTRPISEVKQRRAWGVLRWVTTRES